MMKQTEEFKKARKKQIGSNLVGVYMGLLVMMLGFLFSAIDLSLSIIIGISGFVILFLNLSSLNEREIHPEKYELCKRCKCFIRKDKALCNDCRNRIRKRGKKNE